jgi:hypothetical protein
VRALPYQVGSEPDHGGREKAAAAGCWETRGRGRWGGSRRGRDTIRKNPRILAGRRRRDCKQSPVGPRSRTCVVGLDFGLDPNSTTQSSFFPSPFLCTVYPCKCI